MYMMRRLLWEVTAKNFTINHNHNHKGGGGSGRSDTAVVKVSEHGPLGRGGDGDCHHVVGGEWQNDSFSAAAKEEEPAVMARSDGAGVEKGCWARQSPTSSEMPLRPNSRGGWHRQDLDHHRVHRCRQNSAVVNGCPLPSGGVEEDNKDDRAIPTEGRLDSTGANRSSVDHKIVTNRVEE